MCYNMLNFHKKTSVPKEIPSVDVVVKMIVMLDDCTKKKQTFAVIITVFQVLGLQLLEISKSMLLAH